MKTRLWALALLPFLLFAQVTYANVPLVEPAPVAVPANLKSDQLVRALKTAFVERGWAITKEEPGRLEATLLIRRHTLKVEARYDAQQVTFQYLDSENLDFEEKNGVKYIHRKYAGWMNNVIVSFQRAVLRFQT